MRGDGSWLEGCAASPAKLSGGTSCDAGGTPKQCDQFGAHGQGRQQRW
jgi:hypothetical protein